MDPELKKALDALGMSLKEAVEKQEKAHAAFVDAADKARAQHDAVLDAKLAKLQGELDKFEPLSKALNDINERAKAEEERRKELQAQMDRIEAKGNRPGGDDVGEDEKKAQQQKSVFFDFVRYGAERQDKKMPERVNVLTVSDDTGGGYLAPSQYLMEIIKSAIEFSPMRQLVRVRTTGNRSVLVPKRTGTFAAVWVGEIDTRSETTGLAYGMLDIPAHEMTAEVYISMANLEDSAFDLEGEFRMEAAEQFGVAEGAAIVSGNNTAVKPQGLLSVSGITNVNSGAATTITADGLISLKHAIKTVYARRANFLLNRSSLGAVRKLKDGNGNYLWMPGLAQGKPNSIDGDPYTEVPDMPSEGAGTKPVMYGDWQRAYTLVDRVAMAIVRDALTRASQGQVKFVARRRVGGGVTLPEAYATLTCSAS